MRRIGAIIAVLSLVACPLLCEAQMLADRVPADAILYIGWRGAADLGPGYDQSHFKAFLDQSQVPQLIHKSFPALLQRVETAYPQSAVAIDPLLAVGGPIFNHPTAFYFGPCDVSNPNAPKFHVALLCDAGTDAANMAAKLTSVIAQIPPGGPVQLTVNQFGTLVVLATYDFAEHPDHPLSADTDFTAALGQVSQNPIDILYLSGVQLTQQLDALVQMAPNPQAAQMWPKIRDALGLPGLKKFILTDAFNGKDWMTQAFLDAPAPRQGLAALIDGHPLSDDVLKMVPETAVMASVGEFDLSKLFDEVRSATTQIDAGTGQMLDSEISQLNGMLGFDIKTDLIDAFGDEWIAYQDPDVAGYGGAGIVIINHCRDPQKLESSLSSLEKLANSTISMFTGQFLPLLTVNFRTETIDGMQVHFADLPLVAPAWTIKDGYWYLGLYPQVVVAAAEQAGGKSILDNPAYQDVMQRLG
ncbi:MAG TPA: hypothetical protein VMD30_09640, partial [Tepidisphaeraceae bacterium]|nr:hypothetical protein [Tepidisphaeraceae bacterium]